MTTHVVSKCKRILHVVQYQHIKSILYPSFTKQETCQMAAAHNLANVAAAIIF